MKLTVHDPDTFRTLRPLDLVSYLRATGWHEAEQIAGGKGALWLLPQPDQNDYEILLPLSPTVRDFVTRMGEAIHTLSDAEQRSELEILGDLATAAADVVRLRLLRPDAEDGTVPLEDGVRLIERAQDLLLAAACAAVAPRRSFQTRRPTQAVDYMRQQVRLGQTERGSFVITLISRLPPELSPAEQGMLFVDPGDPFERRATRTLARALSATEHAAQRAMATGDSAPFQEAVSQGFSVNLGDAVAGMQSELPGSLQVDFSWSRSRPESPDTPRRVLLSADLVPIIKEAGRIFRETSPQEDVEIRGPVTALNRPAEVGTITVFSYHERQPRNVLVTLAEPDYKLAIRAHDDRIPVVCYGELVREGRAFRLRNPRGFALEPVD